MNAGGEPAMSLWRPERIHQEELLDHGAGTPEEIFQSLRDLRRINRFLGGHQVSLIPLRRMIRKLQLKEFSLLDVATGSADFPLAVARWARASKIPCRIGAMDINLRHLNFAQESLHHFPEIELIRADIEHFPFMPGSFDFVNVSLFLHHLNDDAIHRFLKNFVSLARIGVMINDLERHWVPYLFLKLTQPIFARSRITRFDGFASLRQAFTVEELRAYAIASGIQNFIVTKRFPYRLAMIISKNHSR